MSKTIKSFLIIVMAMLVAFNMFGCLNITDVSPGGGTGHEVAEGSGDPVGGGTTNGGGAVKPEDGGSSGTGDFGGSGGTGDEGGKIDDYYLVEPSGGYGDCIDGGYYGEAGMGMVDGGYSYDGGYSAPSEGEPVKPDDGTSDDAQQIVRPSGLITASAWNDNQYYDYFKTLFEEGEIIEQPDDPVYPVDPVYPDEPVLYGKAGDYGYDGEITPIYDGGHIQQQPLSGGKFYKYYKNDRWGFNALNRVTVTVKDKYGYALSGAAVTYFGADQKERKAVSDVNGVAYIFPDTDSGECVVSYGEFSQKCAYSTDNAQIEVKLNASSDRNYIIKLMFVVDVTGSMGDELQYLKNELYDVVKRVAKLNGDVKIDLALLFYRDDGDQQKFAYFDFTTVAGRNVSDDGNLQTQLNNLGRQYANGGGDYPEALDEALEMAVGKDWGSEVDSTKVLFHIYDAPPHSREGNKTTYENAVRTAAAKGIRYNPVLCSGADLLCEYLARQAAIHTAGQFIYVTDDSGIGNSHYDPDIPNAVVERFNDLMVRLIKGYYTGTFEPAVNWKTASMGTGVNDIEYSATHITEHNDIGTVAKMINSVEEANQTEQEILSHYSLSSGSQFYCPTVREKLKSYDQSFFAKKKLVYVSIVLGCSMERSLSRVYSDNGKLVVEIVEPIYPENVYFLDVITAHVFFIEIDNSVDFGSVEVKTIKQAAKAE